MKYYHYQLELGGEWNKELGESLTHVMAHVATIYTVPYCYFVTDF